MDILGQTAIGIERAINKRCNGVLIEVDNVELQSFDKRERGYDRVEINALHIWGFDYDEDDDKNKDNDKDKDGKDDGVHIVLQKASHKRYISSLTYKERKELSPEERNGNGNGNGNNFDKIKVWVFLPRMSLPANRNYPIVQSYVDVILRGCLDYGDDFLSQFLNTTQGWSSRSCSHHQTQRNEITRVEEKGRGVVGKGEEEEEEEVKVIEEETNNFVWLEDRDHPFYIRADEDWSKKEGKKLDQHLEERLPSAFVQRKPFSKILGAAEKDEEEFD